jgi:type IV pilus assembly protein PilM
LISKTITALDIGNKNIHIIEGINRGILIEIQKALEIPCPANSVLDGAIEDRSALKYALIEVFSKLKINKANIVLTVQSNSILSRDIYLPLVKMDNMDQAIGYEMEQYLPTNSDNYIIEYRIVAEIVENGIKKYRIKAVAMPKKMVNDYFLLLQELKFIPLSLEVHSNAISKLFSRDLEVNGQKVENDKNLVIIDFGYRTTTINIFSNKVMENSRIIASGSKEIDVSIANCLNMTLEKIEEMKTKELNLNRFLEGDESNDEGSIEVRNVLNNEMSEIVKVLQYFTNRAETNKIEKVYIHGGGSNLKGFPEYVKQALNVASVIKIDAISNIIFRNQEDQGLSSYLNAVGALIRI